MRSALFLITFFDFPEIANLAAEYKLLAGGCAVHSRVSCCGVITLAAFVTALPGLLESVALHLAAELDRRRIAFFYESTRGFFCEEISIGKNAAGVGTGFGMGAPSSCGNFAHRFRATAAACYCCD